MATDERFCDSAARAQNAAECIAMLDEAFESRRSSTGRRRSTTSKASGAPFQTLDELYEDPQVIANGYLPSMTAGNGDEVQLVASPAQFDEVAVEVSRRPEHGEHTEPCCSRSASTGTSSPP